MKLKNFSYCTDPQLNFYRPLVKKVAVTDKNRVKFLMSVASRGNSVDSNNALEKMLYTVTVSTLTVIISLNAVVNEVLRIDWGIRRGLSFGCPQVVEYREAINHLVPDLNLRDREAYPCVFPNWDNTPRKGRKGLVIDNSTSHFFELHFLVAVKAVI
jgi:hypothetical protein